MFRPVGQLAGEHITVHGPWTAPPVGWVKINFDAAVEKTGELGGIAAVAKDHTGLILVWSRKKLHARFDTGTAELLATRLAVSLAREMGFQHIILQGDALTVIKHLQSGRETRSNNGLVYATVTQMLSTFVGTRIEHIRREANMLAHQLCHNFLTDSIGYLSAPFDYIEDF